MKKRIFMQGLTVTLLCFAILFACSKDSNNGSGGGGNNANTVTMKNMVFSNANLQVSAGTQVTWINDDNMNHTVTADDNSFNSGIIPPGGTFKQTFTATGTYNYHCQLHAAMTGRVIVIAP